MKLLTADWHLDDHPDNEYRWGIINHVIDAVWKYNIDEVFNLGDFVDKKDRHAAAFVNRLLKEIQQITKAVDFYVLRGNHDTPLRGPAFWEFANELTGFRYISEPTPHKDIMLLPFVPSPREAWRELGLEQYRALFMHVTYPGAVVDSGHVLEGSDLPMFPRTAKVYSGDVHTPQTFRNFVHVGAPHPVKFGDTYKCRMLVLDNDYNIHEEIVLSPPQKAVVEVASLKDLEALEGFKAGDQVHIRFSLSPAAVDSWGQTEAGIAAWAAARGISVARTEALVTAPGITGDLDPEVAPETLLREYAAQEKLGEDLLNVGLELLKEARK